MLILTKEEAKAIRKLNKQKHRPENSGLISAGIGKSALPEYYVLSFCDRNLSKNVKQLKTMQKTDTGWFKLKTDIEKSLKIGFDNLNKDIGTLEVLIDSYGCLNGRDDKVYGMIPEFEKQLNSRQRSLNEYEKCKIEFENILKESVNG